MRRKEIDLARGFTVFIMTGVHTALIYSTSNVHQSWLGSTLAFLAEGPGAPLFMTLMGISFALSSNNIINTAFKRSIKLLLFAYLLNFLKFIIPLVAGVIPEQLLTDHGISTGKDAFIELILVGDILQLAAISLMVLALLYSLKHYRIWATFFALLIIFISPLLWGLDSSNPVINYVFNLLWTNSTNVYFPVFPWLVFPLVGFASADWFTNAHYKYLLIAGMSFVLAGSFICSSNSLYHWGTFYKTGPGGLLYYVGFVMLWLYIFRLASLYISSNQFFNLLNWLSKNITVVYLVQWITIFWLLATLQYRSLGIAASIILMIVNTAFVFIVSFLITKHILQYQKKSIYEASNL